MLPFVEPVPPAPVPPVTEAPPLPPLARMFVEETLEELNQESPPGTELLFVIALVGCAVPPAPTLR